MQLVFLINNHDLLVSIFGESNLESERDYYQHRLGEYITDYIDEELLTYYGNLIVLVRETDIDMETLKVERINRIITEFNINFKRSLQSINNFVISSFPNFNNGTAILHSVLKQLLIYYQRYLFP